MKGGGGEKIETNKQTAARNRKPQTQHLCEKVRVIVCMYIYIYIYCVCAIFYV